MTDLAERPALQSTPAPQLGDGVELLGEYQSSGFLEQKFLLRRPDGQVVQVPHLLYLVASNLDGRRDADAIAEGVTPQFGRRVSGDNVTYLLEQRLAPLGVLQPEEGESGPLPIATPLFALGLRAAFFPPRLVSAATRPLLFLFRRPVVCAVLAGVVAVDIWLFFIHGLSAAALQVLTNPLLLMVLVVAGVFSGFFHELGHSTACRYGGASPGRIGVGIFIIWPCYYSDVTDTYRLGRTGRLRTDLGGVYFNAVMVLGLAAAYAVTGYKPLLIVIVFQQVEILQQGLPFFRLDGYYVVSDLVGVPDLFGRIRPILASLRPGAVPGPKVTELRPRVRVVVTIWVAFTIVLITGGLVWFIFNAQTFVGAMVDTFSFRVGEVSRTLAEGDYLSAALNAGQAGMVLIPVLGMGLMVSRVRKLRNKRRAEKADASSPDSTWELSAAEVGPAGPWHALAAATSVVSVPVGIAGALGLGVALVQAPWVYALLVPAAVSLAVLRAVLRWTATGEPGDRRVAWWTYGSFLLHLALSLAISASGQTARLFGGVDVAHSNALAILRHWSEGTPLPAFATGDAGFAYGLARLYEVFGPHQVAGLVLTSLCTALAVAFVADTTRRLFGARARLAVLPLLVLLPGLLLWTSQLLREAPILTAVALAANLAVRLSEQVRTGRLVMLGITVAALITLRPTLAYVLAAGLVLGLIVGGRRLLAGVVLAMLATAVVAVLTLGLGVGGSSIEQPVDAELTAAASAVGTGAVGSPTSVALADLPSRLPQFLLGPGSSQSDGLRQGLGVVEALTLWVLVPSLVRGLGRGRRTIGRRAAVLLAPALAMTLALTLLGGSATLVPQRLQVLILLLPFVGLGRSRRPRPRPEAASPPEEMADEAQLERVLQPHF